ncbi:peptidylprolyl isomerase [Pelomonas aquatica]|uniref:peptidylprolyl isomerase n=1 Tax=Pelomonas aquatica TaxID=431058 RepID=UPI0030B91DA2
MRQHHAKTPPALSRRTAAGRAGRDRPHPRGHAARPLRHRGRYRRRAHHGRQLPGLYGPRPAGKGLRHRDGTVSMARGAPGTAAAEFFVCIGDQPELDYGGHRNPDGQGFAAFGRVVQGMEVVRALHARAGAKQWLRTPIAIGPVQRS